MPKQPDNLVLRVQELAQHLQRDLGGFEGWYGSLNGLTVKAVSERDGNIVFLCVEDCGTKTRELILQPVAWQRPKK